MVVKSDRYTQLKARVKAECLRRCYQGSVAEYGGAAYDFTNAPSTDKNVLTEHFEKIATPLRAINPSGLPTAGQQKVISDAYLSLMESKVSAFEQRNLADTSGTDCAASCTGACYGTCATACSSCGASCSNNCSGGCGTSCSTNCSGGCSGDCDGCSGCGSGCASSCRGTCSVTCGNAGCSGSCSTSCYEKCTTSCTNGCSGGCGQTCSTGCTGCGACGSTCTGVSK